MNKRKSTDSAVSPTSFNKKICKDRQHLPKLSRLLHNVWKQNKSTEYSLESPDQSNELQYQASGVKRALHGTIYQLKLLMLIFKRAFDRKQNFKLATELDDAEKFDDIVIQWELSTIPKNIYFQFLQAKHKSDESETITIQNLFSESDEEAFSLQKYFKSYQKLKTRFGSDCVKDIVICTNINFNHDLGPIELLPQSVSNMDNIHIFHMSDETKTTLWHKMKWDTIPQERLDMFKSTSDLRILAKDLTNCINTKGKVDFTNQLFKKYCHSLASNVFDFTEMKFRATFFTSVKPDVIVFRKAMADCLQLTEIDMRARMEKISLKRDILISVDYVKYCVSSPIPHITNPTELAKKLVAAMVVKRIDRRTKIIRANMQSLPGNVFELASDCGDNIKFTKSFLDLQAILRGNVDQLRDSLQQEVNKCGHCQWNDLRNFTFSVTDFPDIRSETYDDSFNLPSSDTTESEIEEFFSKLIFATNTPNESDMSAIIAEAFNNTMEAIGAKVDDLLTGTYMESVLNWMKTRNAYWLTQSKAETYFLGLQQKMSLLQLLSISLHSLMSFRNSGIECANNETGYFNLIDDFVADPARVVLMIKCDKDTSSWLNWLKICTVFQQTGGAFMDSSIVYAPLSTVANLKHNFLVALKSARPFVLVSHCDASFDKTDFKIFQREVNDHISKTMAVCQKKIILIMDVEKYEYFANIFATLPTTSISGVAISLNNLSKRSQEHFLTKEIDLCGRLIRLQHILHSEMCSIFNSCELLKLCRSEVIVIGRPFPTPTMHYIDRTLYRSVFSLDEISVLPTKDKIAISGMNIVGANVNERVLYLSKTTPSIDFEAYIEQNRGKNVHWLHHVESIDNELVHIRSLGPPGCIENLKVLLRNQQEHRIFETDINKTNCYESVCLITAVAGMGKSETLKKLLETVQRTENGVFIVWLNLIDWTNDLTDRSFNTMSDVLDFLYKTQFLESKFGRDLLKLRLETFGRTFIFVDGFDEMIPDYEVQICKLFKILSMTKAQKIYIATRTSSVHVLEHQLNVSPYNINAFSLDDQINYISTYWKAELDRSDQTTDKPTDSKLKLLAKKLIQKFNERTLSTEDITFNGIPLQAHMLGVIYLQWASKESPSFEDAEHLKLDAYRLYQRFVEEKYSRYLSKIINPTFPGAKDIIADLRNIYDIRHEKLAFQEVFPLQAPYVIEAQHQDNELEHFKNAMTGIGIMYYSSERILKFTHRTFSEFLVGVFLGKQAKNPTTAISDIITEKNMLWHPERKLIRYFFDRHLAEVTDCECHVAVLNRDAESLTQLRQSAPNTWFTTLDTMGRTPIHLIASYGLRMLLNDHLKRYYEAFQTKDQLYGWNPVKYGAQIEDWYFTVDILINNTLSHNQMTCKEKSNVLLYAAELGVTSELSIWPVIEADAMFDDIVLGVDSKGYNILHKALHKGSEKSLNFLLDKLKRHPLILKTLLVTKDNSQSSPMVFLRNPVRNESVQKEKETYFDIVFRAVRDFLAPTDVSDVILQTDAGMDTLVHFVIKLQNTTMLRQILEVLDEDSRSKVFAMRNTANATPIDIAMQNHDLEAANICIKFDSQTRTLTNEEISTLLKDGEYEYESCSETSSVEGCEEILRNIEEKEMPELEKYLTSLDTRLRSVLHYAAEDGNNDVVNRILTKLNANGKSDVIVKLYQIRDNIGRIPFHLAAQWGYSEIIDVMLLSLIGNIRISREIFLTVDKEGMSAVQLAAQQYHSTIIKSIVNHLLQDSSENESEDEKVAYLLKMFTLKDSINGFTLLHQVIDKSLEDILEYTLKIFGNHHLKLMALLLENTDPTEDDEENQCNPFLYTVRSNNIKCFQIMVRSLGDYPRSLQTLITSKTSMGLCALHYASCNGNSEILEMLLKLHLDPQEKEAFLNNREQERGCSPLHLACFKKQIECIRLLLKFGANVNIEAKESLTPLHIAVETGSLDITNLLIENGADINFVNGSRSPLDLAIVHKHPNIVKRLLEDDASSFAFFATPCYIACGNGSLEILNMLLEKYGISSCNVPSMRQNNQTPLHAAVNSNHITTVQTLLNWVDKGLIIDPIEGNGFTPLCLAADNGNTEMVALFLQNGANIELTDEFGYSLLLLACKNSRNKMFLNLLEHGASICRKSTVGLTCLHFAAANGSLEIVRMCLNSGLDVESETKSINEIEGHIFDCLLPVQHRKILLDGRGSTIFLKPLHIAAAWGWMDVCSELIQSGATTTSKLYQPIHAAAFAGNAGVELLRLFNGHVDTSDIFGRTLFHWTALSGNVENIRYAIGESKLEKEKLFLKADTDGRTPLHCAVALCRTDAVIYLLKKCSEIGLKIDTADNNGHTVLHTSLNLNGSGNVIDQMRIIDELWKQKEIWPSMENLLLCATASGSIDILDHYLKRNSSELAEQLKTLDCEGNTCLTLASCNKFIKVCEKILKTAKKELGEFEFKRFVDQKNLNASTALHEAVKNVHYKLVTLLLYYGADPTLPNDEGKSSLQLANETSTANSSKNAEKIKLTLIQASREFVALEH